MRILVLAGGSDQIAFITILKEHGHYVLLVDYFKNPPAKSYADRHVVASTLDIDKIREIALTEKIDLICTACTDQALLTVAKVSDELCLPCYLSYDAALNVTNKLYMKSIMWENHILTPKYITLKTINLHLLKDFQFPLVVKPADCNSSKGVKRVESIDELKIALKQAIAFSRSKTAVVEEFETGEEVSADFYIEGNDAKFLCATKSLKLKNTSSFTIIQSYYPAVSSEQEKELLKIAQQIANAFHLQNTPLLIQLIVNNNQFKVLEFSARMGGGSKYKLIERLSGVDIMSKYVDLVLGGIPSVSPLKSVNFAAMNYIYCLPGVFYEVKGLDELYKSGYITDYFVYKTSGMEIIKAETSGDRVAGYLVVASDKQELRDKISYIDSYISIEDPCHQDIMIHGLLK